MSGRTIRDMLRDQNGSMGTKEGREEAHDKHAIFSLRLERETGESIGVLYGTLLGAPYYNPSYGIQFVFEGAYPYGGWKKWRDGVWLVSITGCELEAVYQHMCESRQRYVLRTDKMDFTVEPYELPGHDEE